ncbi:unnamed protein product [Sphenostylis stenocarpa]|uniref:Uncharacterized protein n=1 Tax=Sphenostylis stenocarpa TaxID=92480 RepID=A0AA86S7T3_9FABA|nr:unnamed protein product [Sphenostylis stenocarpa]
MDRRNHRVFNSFHCRVRFLGKKINVVKKKKKHMVRNKCEGRKKKHAKGQKYKDRKQMGDAGKRSNSTLFQDPDYPSHLK